MSFQYRINPNINNISTPIKAKLIFLGDQSVGKSAIIQSFILNDFKQQKQPTVGIDFISKNINIANKTVRLQLWDTAGQQRFQSLIPSYIRGVNAAIIVFDLTNKKSFENINKWVQSVKEASGNQVKIFIVGNKLDLQRVMFPQQIHDKVEELGLQYQQLSAKTGKNVKQFFKYMAETILNLSKQSNQENINSNNIDLTKTESNIVISNSKIVVDQARQNIKKKKKKRCC